MHELYVPFDDTLTQRASGSMKLPQKIAGQPSFVFLSVLISPCKNQGSIGLCVFRDVFLRSPLLRRS
jgi:hypothetical protein